MLHILHFPFMIYLNGLLFIRPGKEMKVKLGREFFPDFSRRILGL